MQEPGTGGVGFPDALTSGAWWEERTNAATGCTAVHHHRHARKNGQVATRKYPKISSSTLEYTLCWRACQAVLACLHACSFFSAPFFSWAKTQRKPPPKPLAHEGKSRRNSRESRYLVMHLRRKNATGGTAGEREPTSCGNSARFLVAKDCFSAYTHVRSLRMNISY